LLGRAQLVVDEEHLRRRVRICLFELRELALPDERSLIGTGTMLHDLGDGGHACGARKLPELGELVLSVDALREHAHHETTLRLRPWCSIGLARGHAGIMPR